MPAGFVLGHSQGGRVALDFTLAYPKRVKALILFGSGPPQGFGLPWSGPDSMPRGQMVKAARAFGIDSIWSFLSNHPLVTNDRLDAATAARLRKIRKTYRGADLLTDLAPAGPAVGTATRLREIQAPTLVLVGDKELPYLKVVAEALGYGIPNATKVVIPGGGHLINLSQRAAFNQAVLGFLATHDRH
jgi:2-succinyl-6-hydroxy-2,4-cyclohexadiene-1-carboxylate synthase